MFICAAVDKRGAVSLDAKSPAISCIVLLDEQAGSLAIGVAKSEDSVSEPPDSGLYGGTT